MPVQTLPQMFPIFSITSSSFILINFYMCYVEQSTCWLFTSLDIFHTLCLNVSEEIRLHDASPFLAVTDQSPLFCLSRDYWHSQNTSNSSSLHELQIPSNTKNPLLTPHLSHVVFIFSPPHIQFPSSMSFTNIHNGAAMVETAATVAVITTTSFKILNKPILSPLIGHKPCPCRRRSSIGQYQYHLVLLIQLYAGSRRSLLQ